MEAAAISSPSVGYSDQSNNSSSTLSKNTQQHSSVNLPSTHVDLHDHHIYHSMYDSPTETVAASSLNRSLLNNNRRSHATPFINENVPIPMLPPPISSDHHHRSHRNLVSTTAPSSATSLVVQTVKLPNISNNNNNYSNQPQPSPSSASNMFNELDMFGQVETFSTQQPSNLNQIAGKVYEKFYLYLSNFKIL